MSSAIFSIDTNKFNSLAFSASGRKHSFEYYTNLDMNCDERLLFQIMAHPDLKTTLFDPGNVLMIKDEFVSTAHVVVSGFVEIFHSDRSYIVGPGAVIGLSEGMAGVKSACKVQAKTAVNTRILPIDITLRDVGRANNSVKAIFRILVSRILHCKKFSESLN